MEKKSKYDTNPLDPDFVRRTDEMRGTTEEVRRAGLTEEQTRHLASSEGLDREAPTRHYPQPRPEESAQDYAPQSRYEDASPTSYPSVFIPPTYQPPATQAPAAPLQRGPAPTSRTVPGIKLPEKWAHVLPYLPFPLVGIIPGIVELLLVPRRELRTRFHAAQGLALHIFVLIISTLFSSAHSIVSQLIGGPLSALLGFASTIIPIAAFIFFLVSMSRAWRGEHHYVAPLADATRWLNEKLEPRK